MAKQKYVGHFENHTTEITIKDKDGKDKKVRIFNDKDHVAAVKSGLAKLAKQEKEAAKA